MNTTARQPLRLLCAFTCAVLPGALACGDGSRADLLIEDVYPLVDIPATRDLRWIVSNGRLIRPL